MMYTMPKNLLSICVNFALATQPKLENSASVLLSLSYTVLKIMSITIFFTVN